MQHSNAKRMPLVNKIFEAKLPWPANAQGQDENHQKGRHKHGGQRTGLSFIPFPFGGFGGQADRMLQNFFTMKNASVRRHCRALRQQGMLSPRAFIRRAGSRVGIRVRWQQQYAIAHLDDELAEVSALVPVINGVQHWRCFKLRSWCWLF